MGSPTKESRATRMSIQQAADKQVLEFPQVSWPTSLGVFAPIRKCSTCTRPDGSTNAQTEMHAMHVFFMPILCQCISGSPTSQNLNILVHAYSYVHLRNTSKRTVLRALARLKRYPLTKYCTGWPMERTNKLVTGHWRLWETKRALKRMCTKVQ